MTQPLQAEEPLGPAGRSLVNLPVTPAIAGLRVRHFEPTSDYAAVADLWTAVNVHDAFDYFPTAQELEHEWTHRSGMDLAEDVVVAKVDGAVVGYAGHQWRIRAQRVFHQLDAAVLPDFRHQGLGAALLGWAEARVARGLAEGKLGADLDMGHVFSAWTDPKIPGVGALADRAGYHIESYGMMMTRSLADPIPAPPLPEGLEVRPVRPEDHRQIWESDVEAFQDHRDPAVQTEQDFEGTFSGPGLDTTLWQVAWDGDEVAGSVMNTIYPAENERTGIQRGWLDNISVRRPWRKRGLATALIARSLLTLRDRGMAEAALGADTENLSGAVHLYESLGFRRVHVHAGYRKAIEVPRPPER